MEYRQNYRFFADGAEYPVYDTPVFPAPYNETRRAEFASFVFTHACTLCLVSALEIASVSIRPASLGLTCTHDLHSITIPLDRPCNFSVEINGSYIDNFCVFASPAREKPAAGTPNLLYFDAGEHEIDKLVLRENNTVLYLEEGAHLYGKIECNGIDGLRICGCGIIDSERCFAPRYRVALDLVGCRNVEVSDICIVSSLFWCLRVFGGENIHIDNVKIIGWRGNNDGIDICGVRHATVENAFIRTHDDSLVTKAFDETDRNNIHVNYQGTDSDFSAGFAALGDVYDITYRHCTLWNDFARPIEIGVSLRTDRVYDVHFRDIDVIHSATGYPIMGIHHGDRAEVSDITFEQIRIEDAPGAQLFDFRITDSVWSTDSRKGCIHDILFRDISLLAAEVLPVSSRLEGIAPGHEVRGVVFEDICLLGRYARNLQECGVDVRRYAGDVTVRCTGDGPFMNPLYSSLTLSDFVFRDGKWEGTATLLLENIGSDEACGQVGLAIAPKHTLPYHAGEYRLRAGEQMSLTYPLRLQAGRYLLSVRSDSAEVECDWKFLELEAPADGFDADFYNYYGDRFGPLHIELREDALVLRGDVLRRPDATFRIYAASAPTETVKDEALFTVEETDFGESNAVIYGADGPELAPQLRCPEEITYVFHNQPQVGVIASVQLSNIDTEAGSAILPLAILEPVKPGRELLLEIELNDPSLGKRRYPCTLFHSVIPKTSAHMFGRICRS